MCPYQQTERQVMEETVAVPEITIDDFSYGDKTLGEWANELTVIIPSLPTQTEIIQNKIIDVNNKYQLAYNCYNELKVVCSAKKSTFTTAKNNVMATLSAEYRTSGVKSPAKDILESLATSNDAVKDLYEDLKIYELIMDFFEDHKIKLEKASQICTSIMYSVKGSDKVHHNGSFA